MKSLCMLADGAFIIASSFLVSLAAIVLTTRAWGWDAGSVAAWVQAVGSFVAIIGAYIVGERQSRATLRATQEAHQLSERARIEAQLAADRVRRAGVFSVIAAAHNRAKEIDDALDDPAPPLQMYAVYHPSLIDSLVDMMSTLPVSDFGSSQLIGSFIVFSGQFNFLKQAVDNYVAGPYALEETNREVAKLREQGYNGDEVKDLLNASRDALRKNVRVHLARIDAEFLYLQANFPSGP